MVLTPQSQIVDPAMEAELLEMAGHSGAPTLDQAMAEAQDGMPLELDLLTSGFYPGVELGDGMETHARHEIGLKALGDLLARMREEAVFRRWGVDEHTLLNMAMYHGHHYVEVDPARRAVVERPSPKSAVRRKVEKFVPWYRQQHSRLTGGKPNYTIRPKRGQQQKNRDAAAMASELAEWVHPFLFSLHNRGEMSMWKILGGSAVIYVGVKWVRAKPGYMVGPDGADLPYMPELDAEILPPQVCWCDDQVPTIDRMRWFGRDLFMPMPEAVATWAEKAQYLMPQTTNPSRGHAVLRKSQRFASVPEDPWGDAQPSVGGPLMVDEEEETTVGEFWLRENAVLSAGFLDWLDPTLLGAEIEVVRDSNSGQGSAVVRFPQGLRVLFTTDGHCVLESGPNIHGGLPFREARFSKSPGFWGYAPATPMRGLQMAFNWLYSMREAHAIKTGNAPLMQPREARINRRGSLTSAFARVLYRANRWGAKPEYLAPPQMSVDVAALQEALEMAWQDIGGIHEVSQAKLPSADLSGVTVSLLQEQDLQQLGYAGEEQEEAFVAALKMALRTIQKFFPSNDPRLVALAGDAPYKLRAFMEADLEGGLDLQCVTGSAIPKSPAAVEAKALELWNAGALIDDFGQPDYRRLQETFGMGTADTLYGEQELDIQNARSIEDQILELDEQQLMEVSIWMQVSGGMLPAGLQPRPEDDIFVHEREHRLRLKRIQSDPRVHPWAVELLRQRWQACAFIVAPLLQGTDPAAAMSMMAGQPMLPAGEESGGGEGGQEQAA